MSDEKTNGLDQTLNMPKEPSSEEEAKGAGHETSTFGETIDFKKSSGASSSEAAAAETPQNLGRYKVRGVLGQGAFGAVYDGYDDQLDRRVAIKVPHLDTEAEDVEKEFLEEARRLAQLKHPSIVAVYDVGVHEGQCYIVSDYITGGSLQEWLASNKPTWQESASIVAMLAEALAHAHAQRTVHRDIKPENILLAESPDGMKPVLVDFGLAISESQGNSDRGYVSGTPTYMSPEQSRGVGHRIDGRTDIYGLGVVLYHLLCGRLPFRADNLQELLRQVREDEPQPPRQLVPSIPRDLERICLKAMEKKINDRYTTSNDLAEEIRQVLFAHGESVRDLGSSAPITGEAGPKKACPTCGVENPVAVQFCPSCGTSTSGDSAMFDVATQKWEETPSASSTMTSTQRRRAREAERRRITVLSCSCEFTDADHELDPEEQHEQLQQYQHAFENIVAGLDGTILQSSGQELVVCFGYPVAQEDAARRAASTGLKLLAEVDRINQETKGAHVEAWVGVHTGMAVVEDKSETDSVEPISIVGDVRTIANRLEEVGDGGTLVVSGDTQQVIKGYFELEDLGSQKFKRVTRPVAAYQVLAETQAMDRIDAAERTELTPLIGRDTEMSVLRDRWEQAEEEMGQVVLLVADAGLGKSRLIRELKDHLSDEASASPIIEWRCSAHYENTGFYSAIEFFQRHLEFSSEDSAEDRLDKIVEHLEELDLDDDEQVVLIAGLLSVPLEGRYEPLALSPQKQREMTQEVLLDWLRAVASDEPVLFVLEDLHWCDPSTLELIEQHVQQCSNDKMLTLLTFRPEFEAPWKGSTHQSTVALNRLTKRQIREMMITRTGVKDLPQEVVDQVIERTDGVPLFVEEFTKLVEESDVLSGDADVSKSVKIAAIPATLQDLLMARLERMASAIDIVQLGATIGREFTHELINAACEVPEDELQEELDKLVAAELLFAKGRPPKCTYTFKHALIQDAAYDSLLKKTRHKFHKQIADVLEEQFAETAESQPELLAHHFTEAGEGQKAIEYWLKAGQHAQALSANVEAISHLEKGLALLKGAPEAPETLMAELGFRLSLSATSMGVKGYASTEAAEHNARAVELCETLGEGAPLFPVKMVIWAISFIRGQLALATSVTEELRALAEQAQDDGMLTEANWASGCNAWWRGDFAAALDYLKKGEETYSVEKSTFFSQFTQQNSGPLMRAYIAMSLWALGYAEQANEKMDEAVALAEELKHPFTSAVTYWKPAIMHQLARDGRAAEKWAKKVVKLSNEQAFAFWAALGVGSQGSGLSVRGKDDEAIELISQACAAIESTGCEKVEQNYLGCLADAQAKTGKQDEAWASLNRALELNDRDEERFVEAELHRRKGEFQLAGGENDQAEQSFQQAMEVAQKQDAKFFELRAATQLARLWQQQGKLTEAAQLVSPLVDWFTEGLDAPDIVEAKELLASLG